eukprot:scaffold348_cov329-Pavlova_lutheri.AAC.37
MISPYPRPRWMLVTIHSHQRGLRAESNGQLCFFDRLLLFFGEQCSDFPLQFQLFLQDGQVSYPGLLGWFFRVVFWVVPWCCFHVLVLLCIRLFPSPRHSYGADGHPPPVPSTCVRDATVDAGGGGHGEVGIGWKVLCSLGPRRGEPISPSIPIGWGNGFERGSHQGTNPTPSWKDPTPHVGVQEWGSGWTKRWGGASSIHPSRRICTWNDRNTV